MNSDKRPIQIEDLLRLKRAERPPAEFWSEFDRQLRAKQLAAIVAKRPWWQRVPNLFSGFTRYHLPLGAAAVVAVTFISLRDDRPAATAASVRSVSAQQQAGEINGQRPVATPAVAEADTRQATNRSEGDLDVPIPRYAVASPSLASAPRLTPLPEGAPLTAITTRSEEVSISAEGSDPIAEAQSLAAVSTPMLSHSLLASTASFENRGMSRPAIEPLQTIALSNDRARSRMLTAMVSMAANELPTRMGERTAPRIDEDRLSDQIRRLDARGDRLILKF